MTNNVQKVKEDKTIMKIIKGTITSFIITLILIMLISIILVNSNISENIISPGIFVITCISIFAGAMSSIRKNGIAYGGIIGIIYILTLYLLSSILNGEFNLTISSLILITLSIMSGIICGIVGVNIKKGYK